MMPEHGYKRATVQPKAKQMPF